MADDNSADSFAEARTKLSESIEQNVERSGRVATQLDKTLISLSAGALVFSMTFVGTFAPGKLLLPLLFFAWAAFAACLVSFLALSNPFSAFRFPPSVFLPQSHAGSLFQ